jgi:hypothetical protein
LSGFSLGIGVGKALTERAIRFTICANPSSTWLLITVNDRSHYARQHLADFFPHA